MRPTFRVSTALACALWLTGCGGDGISVYEVPHEAPGAVPPVHAHAAPPAGAPGGMPGMPGMPGMGGGAGMPTGDAGAVIWTPAAGWVDRGASGMRAATYGLPGGAELTVVTLPGESGGLLPNVNRWRGQLALPPVDDAGLKAVSRSVTSPAGPVTVVEFPAKAAGTRLLGGILVHGEATWFFKATGPDAAVVAARPAVLAFLQGLRPRGGR